MAASELPSEPAPLLRYVFEQGFDADDEAVVTAAFADSVELLQPVGPDSITPEELWQQDRAERAAMPDYGHDIEATWQTGDTAFARYRASGTFENELSFGNGAVFEPTGEDLETVGLMQARVPDGRITAFGAFWDRLGMFQQAGIVPSLAELAD